MRKLYPTLAALAVTTLFASPTLADTVLLANGDRLSGHITAVTPDTVNITTPYTKAAIPIKTVKALRSDTPVPITAADGATHTAFVSPNPNGSGFIETAAAPPAETAAATPPTPPVAVVPAAPPLPAPAESKIFPRLDLESYCLPIGPHWKDSLALGIVNTTGNTSSTQFSGELGFHYDTKPLEFSSTLGGNYGTSNGTPSAEQFYNDNILRRFLPELHTDRLFVFAEDHNLYDGLKGISLRSINAVGLGYDIIQTPKLTVSLRAGPGFTYEHLFDGSTHTDAVGLAGLHVAYALTDKASLSEDAGYSTAFADNTRYQAFSETAFNLKLPEIQRGLGLKFSFRDDYDNTVHSPLKQNDTKLILALTLDF